jgi:DNA-binding response OmpR family regulator
MVAAKPSILLIDDQEGIVNFLTVKLKGSGYRVSCARDGEKGLELARKTNPDLILLDIIMPGIDGIDVLRSLRQFSDVPVIVLSIAEGVNEKVMAMGATAFVSKPFDINELMGLIKATLEPNCSPGE